MATVNGLPVSVEQMTTLALTNYGHFTTMRLDDGGVRGLSLHLARLVQDCAAVFGARLDPERVLSCVRQEVGRRAGPLIVRVTVFDPALDLARPAEKADPHILVTTRPAGALSPPPLRVRSLAFHRDAAAVKHVALFGQLRMRRAAQLAGFDDVLFTDSDGRISEGCTWNIGFVDEAGQVVWPDAEILPGVTMRLLRTAHAESTTRTVRIAELRSMRAAFATSAAVGVRAIHGVDDTRFPDDDAVLATLREAYAALPTEHL
ncbi:MULTISPECIES: aminotransferase class IV [unclassified Streptomyces]|uniref:aminotransferase class IV n=1 Tax=unclassified Streptomyces TaxID=2593676 RepID=UPI003009068C